jgi:hypothetical protein
VGESQDVGFTVAEDFQQQPGLALTGAVAVAGGGRQSDQHTIPELFDQLVLGVVLDRLLAPLASEVGLMDQPAQRLGDLGWPVRLGIGLSGTGEITE